MKKFFEYILNHPKTIVSIYIFLSIVSIFHTTENLEINTSTDELISSELDFKINQKKFKKSFKILNNNVLIRIEYDEKENGDFLTKEIVSKLDSSEFVNFVYSPSLDETFKENFFLFLNDLDKDLIIGKLYDYQPFLSGINNHENRLEGFNNLLELSIENNPKEIQDLSYILDIFSQSLSKKEFVDWKNLLSSQEKESFILFGVEEMYLNDNGFSNIYKFLDEIKKTNSKSTTINFTGGLIIDHEEVSSVSSGAIYSGLLSFALVGLLLWFAFKNFLIIFSILFTILIGLTITLGLTTIFVGSLNLISVAFAVLFIGLSVDYGIQVCSRISEKKSLLQNGNLDYDSSIFSISKILFIASIPSIIGFMSFIPTHYIGLSELGIISAIGLIVGLILNITFLPSIIKLIFKKKEFNFYTFYKVSIIDKILKSQYLILFLFFIVLIYTSFNFKKIDFDSDALNLKDQNLQSVKLAKELIEKNPTSDYIASIILRREESSNFNAQHSIFENENIKSYFSYNKIFEKYESEELDYLKFLLSGKSITKSVIENDEINRFLKLLNKIIAQKLDSTSEKAENLRKIILNLQGQGFSSINIQSLLFKEFDQLILFINNIGKIPEDLSQKISENFTKRYISDDTLERIEIFPSKDLSIPKNLMDFVEVVESYFPHATGMPIIQFKAGNVVIDSFVKALTISLVFLIVFLIIIFRNTRLILLCLFSLTCAFILTIFFMIVLKINLNFANMIAIPLIFSLGISYPIYFLKRYQEFNDVKKIFESNTPIAILFSGLTTTFSFSTLYLSTHQGTSSMGMLLFISLSNTLISCLILLPIFLKMTNSK